MYHAFPPTFVQINNFNFYSMFIVISLWNMIKKKNKTVKVKTPKNYRSSGGSSGRLPISLDKKTCGGYKLKYPLRYIKIILNCLTPDDLPNQRFRTSLQNMNGKYQYLSILIDNWPCSIDTYRYFPSLNTTFEYIMKERQSCSSLLRMIGSASQWANLPCVPTNVCTN